MDVKSSLFQKGLYNVVCVKAVLDGWKKSYNISVCRTYSAYQSCSSIVVECWCGSSIYNICNMCIYNKNVTFLEYSPLRSSSTDLKQLVRDGGGKKL